MSKDTEKEKVQKNGSRRTRRTSLSAAHLAIAMNLAMANTVATNRVTRSMAARTRAMAVTLAIATPRVTRAMTAKGRVRDVTRALAKTVPAAKITRGLARTCASLMLQALSNPSTGRWLIKRQQVTPLYWVRVRHVDEIVAYEAIIRAMFHGCVELRSRGATPSILGAHFLETVEVGFARREDARAAVELFRSRIDILCRTWTIKHCTPQLPPDAAFSSRLTVSQRQDPPPEVRISGTSRLSDAFRSDDSHMVIVYIVDPRTPPQVVVLLFQTLGGRLRRCTFLKDTDGCFSGIVELEYERREDAATVAKRFHRNIRIFGRKFWEVVRVQSEDVFNNSDNDNDNDNNDDDDEDEDDDDDD